MSPIVARLLVALALLSPAIAYAQEPTVVTGRITTRDDGLPVPGATVAIPTLKLTAVTDSDGRYQLTVPAAQAKGQEVELSVTVAGLQPRSVQIKLASGAVTLDVALSLSLPRRSPLARAWSARKARRPYRWITSAERLAATGVTELMQAIQSLAPSFNFPRPTVSDGTDSVRPATLRGLGPDQVLVLLNGKRRHQTALIHINSTIGRGSAGVDLNAIPLSAVERVEILRDAAAAQYGSDAIAGVINIVLKSGAQAAVALQGGGNFGWFTEVTGATRDFSDGGSFDSGRTVRSDGGRAITRSPASFATARGPTAPATTSRIRSVPAMRGTTPWPSPTRTGATPRRATRCCS